MSAVGMAPAPRSYLFVPGNRPERFEKARASGADMVVLDLEDAVAPQERPAARAAIADWLARTPPAGIALRVNAAGTGDFAADLALCRQVQAAAVLLPKAESAAEVAAIHAAARADIVAIVETAAGMAGARALAAAPGLQRLAFGTLDFAVDLALAVDEAGAQDELAAFRSELVLASRLAQRAAPVDGVTTALGDEARLMADTLRARRFGFGGKLCIHPRQIGPVHAAFAPDPAQLAWAERVLAAVAAAGGAAVQVDGRMVDRPVVLQAEAIVAQARH